MSPLLLLLSAPTWLWGRCGINNSPPSSSVMALVFRCSDGSHAPVDTVQPSLLRSSSLSSAVWYHLQSFFLRSLGLFTWPNHFILAFLHLSVTPSTFSLSLMLSFLTWTWTRSLWPHAHLHIFIYVTSSFFTWELVTGPVSIPYSIAGWTILLWIFPFKFNMWWYSLIASSSSCCIHTNVFSTSLKCSAGLTMGPKGHVPGAPRPRGPPEQNILFYDVCW